MTSQLRLYTINRGHLDEFAAAWRSRVLPLRESVGYRVPFAATIAETNQFVWLLEHDGADWQSTEAAYYASAARTALDPDPAQLIARGEHFFVQDLLSEGARER